MSPRLRIALAAALLVAIVAGVALAALLAGDDEPAGPAATTATAPAETSTTESSTTEARTQTDGGPTTGGREPAASPADERGIVEAVETAVANTEAGRPPPGIKPGSLPGSDELSIDSVRAEGDRGSATLSSGAVVLLRREGGSWRVVSVRAP